MSTWLSKFSKSIAVKLAAKWLGVRAWLLSILIDAMFKHIIKPMTDMVEDYIRRKNQEKTDRENLKKYQEAMQDGANKQKQDDAITDLLNGGM